MRKKGLKELAKAKARTELRKVKAELNELKNPFRKAMEFLDKIDKVQSLVLNVGLAAASLNALGKYREVETYVERIPYTEKVVVNDPRIVGGRTVQRYQITVMKYREVQKQRLVTKYNPAAALVGPVGLKLAQSANVVAGAAGVAALSAIGITTVAPAFTEGMEYALRSLVEPKKYPSLMGGTLLLP